MRVAVLCEYSGVVRDAFIRAGHEAISCDILPTESDGPHIQGDLFNHDWTEYDLIIAHPPCTHLSSAGAPSWKIKQKDGRQKAAIEFVLKIAYINCDKIVIENPVGILSSIWRKPDQIINPYQFGDAVMKRTCLWLRGVPALEHTNIVKPKYHHCSSSYRGGARKDGTRQISNIPIKRAWDTGKERSKFFVGIADAMAVQWGGKNNDV